MYMHILVTVVFVNHLRAFPAANLAAPKELAVTVLGDFFYHGVVSSTTAHQFATINAITCPVAFAMSCP